MDTGGGEFLSSLQPLPPVTIATEGYLPNVPVAKARLGPLGVEVIDTWAPVPLPFEAGSFDLVINRHGGYRARELYRVLKPGKSFITQQVGGKNCIRLNEMLQDVVDFEYSYWTLDYALRELVESGFHIIDQREDYPSLEFVDIGAVVYYLKVISWQVSGFTIEKYYDKLARIHNLIQETGRFVVTEHRFYIEAQKPIL
jgi:SAM-dependent methyltransferase